MFSGRDVVPISLCYGSTERTVAQGRTFSASLQKKSSFTMTSYFLLVIDKINDHITVHTVIPGPKKSTLASDVDVELGACSLDVSFVQE